LDAAEAGWKSEREEFEALRRELADAYEAQGKDLEASEQEVGALRQRSDEVEKQAAAAVADSQKTLEEALRRAERAEARIEEMVAQTKTLTTERDRANETSIQAREKAARLSGQLEALQVQQTALLERLGP
jgi:colicin import membrane protein